LKKSFKPSVGLVLILKNKYKGTKTKKVKKVKKEKEVV